jgi:arsenate reductase
LKSWAEFAAPGAPVMDFVVTVCDDAAGEMCPARPGQPMTARWGIADAAAMEGPRIRREAEFAAALRHRKTRITLFTSLPLSGIDRMALGTKLRDIGHLTGSTLQRSQAG